MRVASSSTSSARAGSGNEGNKAMKDGGMVIPRDRWNTHEVSVEHARGFSGASVELQWSFSGAGTGLQWRCGAVGGGGVLEPLASSDFLGKSWEILEPVTRIDGSHRSGVSG